MKGKFIVIYGINNIGKSVQTKKLVSYFRKKNKKVERIKYPVYNIKPSGPFIYKILHSKQNISSEEFQMWFTLNRFQFEPKLKKKLAKGIFIISESYIGTGIAWGAANGVNQTWLEELNKYLIKADISILLDGKQFQHALEKDHIYESNKKLVQKTRSVFLKLAKKYKWSVVNANHEEDKVHQNILKIINRKL